MPRRLALGQSEAKVPAWLRVRACAIDHDWPLVVRNPETELNISLKIKLKLRVLRCNEMLINWINGS